MKQKTIFQLQREFAIAMRAVNMGVRFRHGRSTLDDKSGVTIYHTTSVYIPASSRLSRTDLEAFRRIVGMYYAPVVRAVYRRGTVLAEHIGPDAFRKLQLYHQ